MYDLICVGDTTYDIFIKPHEAEILRSTKSVSLRVPFEKLLCFAYGDKIEVEDVQYSLGGTACNVAAGAAKLGLKTGLMSFCGADDMGEKIKSLIEKENIDLVNFVTDKTIHSTYSFIIRYKNDRTILVYRDNFNYDKLKISKISAKGGSASGKSKTKWVYLSSLGKGYEKEAVSLASEKNVKIALNPGKMQLEKKQREFMFLLKLAEIVFLNKEEAELLLGARFPLTIEEIYYKISGLGIKNAIVTDGANGAYARVDKKIIHQKSMKAQAIETTGAGDAFASGFLAIYIKEGDVNKSLLQGVKNGASVIEKIGAQTGLLH